MKADIFSIFLLVYRFSRKKENQMCQRVVALFGELWNTTYESMYK